MYDLIHNDLPLRILVGHKGVGKSAAFKISCEENRNKKRIAIWIRPDDIMELCQEKTNLLQMIRDWKKGLSDIIFEKVIASVGLNIEGGLGKSVNIAGKLIGKITELFKQIIDENISY